MVPAIIKRPWNKQCVRRKNVDDDLDSDDYIGNPKKNRPKFLPLVPMSIRIA